MAWEAIGVNEIIENKKNEDSEFCRLWNESRAEYETIGAIIRLRKEKGLSQEQLAQMSGNKQQVISRIENKENSPTLKTLCSILDVLGYKISFIPK
ncbi:MAG: helix-turn-helix transcriptional regulator [Clostridiales bacterium]|nr:helix-turn-helix transcriptional regulator [Clostridiales bacterium]